MTALVVGAWVALSHDGVDPTGRPLGADFLSFWTAARLALQSGAAASAYDHGVLGAAQLAAFPGADPAYLPFSYPPGFLLIIAPLGFLPYFPALLAWLGLTGVAYVQVVRRWLGSGVLPWFAVLAYPAILINIANGQSGFLTGALMGAGALLLPRRPLLAGICLGLLSFKPHLGLLVPVALLAARQPRAIAGAAAGCIGLAGASLLFFGPAPWQAFLRATQYMRKVVEEGQLDPAKLQSVFGALRVWQASLWTAYGAQIAIVIFAAIAVGAVAWRLPRSRAVGPVLIAATALSAPYLLDYDLTLVAIPIAWVFSEAIRSRFLPGERLILLGAYVLPLVARPLAMTLHAPIAVPALGALLFITVRRAWFAEATSSASQPEQVTAPGGLGDYVGRRRQEAIPRAGAIVRGLDA
jgi:hypothetical protein